MREKEKKIHENIKRIDILIKKEEKEQENLKKLLKNEPFEDQKEGYFANFIN